jgi:peptidyl-prolyl isomerase D
LDGRHVVFGRVLKGQKVVRAIESQPTGESDKPKEDCTIVDCGEIAEGADDGVPPPADGDLIADFPQDEGVDSTDAAKIVEIADKIKTIGNNHFRAQKFDAAAEKYDKALRYATFGETPMEADLKAKLREIKLSCNLNNAMCHIKLKSWRPAVTSATSALKIDAGNVKALYRRATANANLNEFETALEDLKHAQTADPENADIKTLLATYVPSQ